MKTKFWIVLLGGGMLVSNLRAESTVSGNLNFWLGQKFLNSDWKDEASGSDARRQGEWGLLFDVRPQGWPVNLAVDYAASERRQTVQGADVASETTEIAVGVRKYFLERSRVRPFVGGGLLRATADVKVAALGFNDSANGYWGAAGVLFKPSGRLNAGIALRYSAASVTVRGESANAGGYHWGGFIGFSF